MGFPTFSYDRIGGFSIRKITQCKMSMPCNAHALPDIHGLTSFYKNIPATGQDETRMPFNFNPSTRNTPTRIESDNTTRYNGVAVVPGDTNISGSNVTLFYFAHCLLSNKNRSDKTTI